MNIESKYPGMREHLRIGGISVQVQTKHAVRTVVWKITLSFPGYIKIRLII